MGPTRILLLVAIVLVLGVPFLLRGGQHADRADDDARTLIVVTPHAAQLREEFGRAFDRWHRREHGEPVRIDYRTPGGTSEIIRQLQAQYTAAFRNGHLDPVTGEVTPGVIGYDLMFGGGSFDHGRLKRDLQLPSPDGEGRITIPMSIPAGFDQAQLDAWYGPNRIGTQYLYDEDQYWLGTALSSFGIVYNRDLTQELLGRRDLSSFEDLTDPRLSGWVALADPRQSGSITTTFDSILGNYGWDEGWRILRAMAANTRYFTNSATKPPIDVSQGEAAAGLAIDFYGRSQAQVVARPGESPDQTRVGYADPAGAVYVDADPVSILRGGPDPELARRFVEFCLTEEAQALWQFPARRNPRSANNPPGPDGEPMGPIRHELRRMPVRRIMYEKYMNDHFIDRVDPFEIASDVDNPGWRNGVQVMMGAFAIDIADHQRRAWRAMHNAAESGADPATLEEMDRLFYAFPSPSRVREVYGSMFDGSESLPEGALLEFTPENFRAIRDAWRDPRVLARLRIVYTRIYRENYRRIEELARETTAEGR